jgi:hypothetical protein
MTRFTTKVGVTIGVDETSFKTGFESVIAADIGQVVSNYGSTRKPFLSIKHANTGDTTNSQVEALAISTTKVQGHLGAILSQYHADSISQTRRYTTIASTSEWSIYAIEP